MTVAELIAELQNFGGHLPVVVFVASEPRSELRAIEAVGTDETDDGDVVVSIEQGGLLHYAR